MSAHAAVTPPAATQPVGTAPATRAKRFPRAREVLRNAGRLYAQLATNHPIK